MKRRHLEGREGCPHLPGVEEVLTAEVTRRLAGNYGAEFYLAALRYAQSLWMEGRTAQALLQLNKALMADLDGSERVLLEWPLPYAAKVWLMAHCPDGEFLGNPVRHYQHLATRIPGAWPDLRRWRAWACFHLAEAVLPAERCPRDEEQLAREGIEVPEIETVLERLGGLGLPGEVEVIRQALEGRAR